MNKQEQIERLQSEWKDSPRWKGIERNYSAADVVNLRGTFQIEHTLARHGAEKLWRLVNQELPLCALGALTGNQAIQEIQAGLKAIYCSGWQVVVMATARVKCIRIKACIRSTRCQKWSHELTTRFSVPTKYTH